jgi:hypothetical protein
MKRHMPELFLDDKALKSIEEENQKFDPKENKEYEVDSNGKNYILE